MAYSNVKQTQKSGLFSNLANPVIRKLKDKAEVQCTDTATYSGIIKKTVFFLLMTVVGVFLCFILHNIYTASASSEMITFADTENDIYNLTIHPIEALIWGAAILISLITPFLAWFIAKTIPVTGTIYSISQGIIAGAITVALAPQYKYLSVLALLITLALVGGMMFVYSKGIIKVTAKFRGVIVAVFFAIILAGILFFLINIIPPVRNFIMGSGIGSVISSPGFTIVVSIIFVIIAALFMLADFDAIQQCVENKVDKKYEWMAAWGLAYTILYIYFKILRILTMIFGNAKSSSKSGNRF